MLLYEPFLVKKKAVSTHAPLPIVTPLRAFKRTYLAVLYCTNNKKVMPHKKKIPLQFYPTVYSPSKEK